MSVKDNACNWAVAIANDSSHGYSQAIRWGPDYDCSSFVISAFEQAGVPVRTRGSTFTGNMPGPFLDCGFKDVKDQVNLNTGEGLMRGDVLLNVANHTCLYIGNGQVVNARTDTDGRSGDSHGDEIRIQSYWNYNPWDMVLRYFGTETLIHPSTEFSVEISEDPEIEIVTADIPARKYILLKRGMKGPHVGGLQSLLNYHGASLNVDNEFGKLTESAVINFQFKHGLEADGIAGEKTFTELIKEKQ